MKKPTILLVSSHEGFRITYSLVLSESFHVISRDSIPEENDFVLRRARLIFVVNQRNIFPDYYINEIAQTTEIPVVILCDTSNASLNNYARRNPFLTVLVNPVANKYLIGKMNKIFEELKSEKELQRRDRDKTAGEIFKKAYKSTTFRKKIDKVVEHIHKNYAIIDNFKQVADDFDLNYESMRQAIEHKTGKLPREYLKAFRLEKMLQLIQFSMFTIEEICVETGFKDAHYAQEQFQNHFGISMLECIAQFRNLPY